MYPESDCVLSFSLGYIRDGCDFIDVADASISVTITGPGGVEGPVITLAEADSVPGGALYWTKWKPAAGETYTATATLTCGYADPYVREFEITIPDPASTSCICCTDETPDYITISGLTGVGATVNGTYALTAGGIAYEADFGDGAEVSMCVYQPVTQPPFAAAPTGSVCSALHPDILGTFSVGLDDFFVYEGGGDIYVWTPNAFSIAAGYTTIRIRIKYYYTVYRRRFIDGTCGSSPTTVTQEWEYEIDCNTGEASLIDEDDNYSFAVSSLGTPVVNLYLDI